MSKRINGIQQLGVGVTNVKNGFDWYRKHFGMDIKMFDDEAVAELMLPHTEGKTRKRHAILALNMQGGGGFEIWQHTAKKPEKPKFEVRLGDLGICAGKIKSADLQKTYNVFKENKLDIITKISKDPSGNEHFYVKDTFGNIWNVVYSSYIHKSKKLLNGGVFGAAIGVKNIDDSLKVYKDILGYDTIIFDKEGKFDDLNGIPGGDNKFRRILLKHSKQYNGSFSPLLGPSQIELFQVLDREPQDIFKDRIWGDLGFIHLCFDINGMDELRNEVKEKGFPFTVDSAKAHDSFDMGEAAGNFSYIQAPEGTLIEFVETHKIPLFKKLNWYINLQKRGEKPLPNWMFSLFQLMRVK